MSRVRSRPLLAVAGSLVVLGLLTVLALELAHSQNQARRHLETKYLERAQVSAALTESLFAVSASTGAAENAKRFGSERVSAETMARTAKRGQNLHAVLLAEDGSVLAASPGTPEMTTRELSIKPGHVRSALGPTGVGLSNLEGRAANPYIEFVQAFPTPFGRRLLVTGLSPKLIFEFLGGYLDRVPNIDGGRAYLIDGNSRLIGTPTPGLKPGGNIEEPGLLDATRENDKGTFGDDRYFASSAPIEGSAWRVVATAPRDELFATVEGSRKWVPWIIFVAFAIAAALVLLLVSRLLRAAAEVQVSNDRLEAANDELGVSNRKLERGAAELKRSNEQLEQFASIASHDLQEPLRKMQTFGDQLKRDEATASREEGRDYLRRMSDAAGRMQRADRRPADVLARRAPRRRPFVDVDLAEWPARCGRPRGRVIDETGATVEIGELPTVEADPLQMRQLLQNLIANALKFHRDGRRRRVAACDARVADGSAELTVTDNGIGFEPAVRRRASSRSSSACTARSDYPGTGIGLALCRKIVERHGGTITADERARARAPTSPSRCRVEQADAAGSPPSHESDRRGGPRCRSSQPDTERSRSRS